MGKEVQIKRKGRPVDRGHEEKKNEKKKKGGGGNALLSMNKERSAAISKAGGRAGPTGPVPESHSPLRMGGKMLSRESAYPPFFFFFFFSSS